MAIRRGCKAFNLPVIPDAIEGNAGPLAGLHASLSWALGKTPGARYIASVPADTPFLPLDLVARLVAAVQATGASSAIAASMGRQHPVVGLWDVSLLGNLGEALHFGMRAMHRFAEQQRQHCRGLSPARSRRQADRPVLQREYARRSGDRPRALCSASRRVAEAVAPLIGIVGWKGSGKTTLIERLVAVLTQRGLQVATVKHSHHALRPSDGATDGERHARAGACATAVLAPDEWELAGKRQASPPPGLDEVAARLAPADLILVEGFKSALIPKIEVRAAGQREPLLAGHDAQVIAVAADQTVEAGGLPLFERDDIDGIAAFILARVPHLRP